MSLFLDGWWFFGFEFDVLSLVFFLKIILLSLFIMLLLFFLCVLLYVFDGFLMSVLFFFIWGELFGLMVMGIMVGFGFFWIIKGFFMMLNLESIFWILLFMFNVLKSTVSLFFVVLMIFWMVYCDSLYCCMSVMVKLFCKMI